jgi:hypothetical protein
LYSSAKKVLIAVELRNYLSVKAANLRLCQKKIAHLYRYQRDREKTSRKQNILIWVQHENVK